MCGIFGIINTKEHKFDSIAFNVLGINNDSRGGDSCGIFIDGEYEYGVNDKKLYYNFFPDSSLLNKTEKCTIALGHCRKASVGVINEASAQPVIIKGANESVEFVLMHNGTISNYKELAKKYIPETNIDRMTDSQVIARIIYNSGTDVLGEYIGTGAFVFVDYRYSKPKIFFFKGSSKTYSYSTEAVVERPLFCIYNENEFIFSSIIDYLEALKPGLQAKTIVANRLIELKDGKLYIIKEYNRESVCQNNYVASTHYQRANYNNNVNDELVYADDTDDYYTNFVELDLFNTYTINGINAHGIFSVTPIGQIVNKRRIKSACEVAFFNGVLLKNINCFKFLTKFCKDFELSAYDLTKDFPEIVWYLSPLPARFDNIWYKVVSPNKIEAYSGSIYLPFTTDELLIQNGYSEYKQDCCTYSDTLKKTLLPYKSYKVDSEALMQSIII